jgi:hypothetical protein
MGPPDHNIDLLPNAWYKNSAFFLPFQALVG